MTDHTEAMLPALASHRIKDLNLGNSFIYPNYAGKSILNIPDSLCRLFGVPEIGGGPLAPEILDLLDKNYRHIVLVLMDALALQRLQRWMDDGTAPVWKRLADEGCLSPITSITPSTTSAALTALWSGKNAAQHCITGYEMWMKEYGVVANTILHTPITFRNDVGGLKRAGFDPEKILPFKMLGTHLNEYGVKTYALQHSHILRSGLSKMLFRDVEASAFNTAADLWINLRHLLENKAHERFYAWIYWSEVDHFGHIYGPDDERTAAEFSTFSQAMAQLFLARLGAEARRDTLLILTADHGQITTPTKARYELRSHPDLLRMLHIFPTGENRLAFLYIKPGQTGAVQDYVDNRWPGEFAIIESGYAINNGLFGPGKAHPDLHDRTGDFILVAKNDAYLWWGEKKNPLIGRHGGLHPDEMLVPFLAVNL